MDINFFFFFHLVCILSNCLGVLVGLRVCQLKYQVFVTTVRTFLEIFSGVNCTGSLKSVVPLQFTSAEALSLGLSGLEFAVLRCLLAMDCLWFVKAACPSDCWRVLQSATAKVFTCFRMMNHFERLRHLLSMFFLCIFLFSFLLFPPPPSLSLSAKAMHFIPCLERLITLGIQGESGWWLCSLLE